MSALSKVRPQQRPCAGTCGRRITVAARDLFKVQMPNRGGGGTHMDGAWDCPVCGHRNVIPASHLQRGLLQELQLRGAPGAETPRRQSPPPVWRAGAEGRRMLAEALARVADGTAHAAPMVRRGGSIVPEPTLDSEGRLLAQFRPDRILDTLDSIDCVALVVHGSGRDPWTTVFDPRSGAASLAR